MDQALDTGGMCLVDQIAGNHQIVLDEIGRLRVIGHDAADLGGGDNHQIRLFCPDKGSHGGLICEVQGCMGDGDDVMFASCHQLAQDRTAHHAIVACQKNPHRSGPQRHGHVHTVFAQQRMTLCVLQVFGHHFSA